MKSAALEKVAAKPVTIKDIAEEVGVTKMTVSLALSGKGRVSPEMRAKIGDVARRLRYEPNLHAQSLTQGRSNLIGLFSAAVSPGVQTQIIEFIQSALNQKGYDVPLYGYGYHEYLDPANQGEIMGALCRQRPRAIVCNLSRVYEPAMRRLEDYVERGGILIGYGPKPRVPLPCDQVIVDYEGMAYLSARYLLELGHREIGLYCSGLSSPDEPRPAGFKRALLEAGIQPRESWLFDGPAFEEGGACMTKFFLALEERPTAMILTHDAAASVFVNQLQRAGMRIPDDVSVVGHHGFPVSEYALPSITTIAYPVATTAQRVVEMLDDRLTENYTGAPREAVMHGELIARESTRALVSN